MFEDRKVKAEATAKAQAVVPDVVFGSNTSTLPITSLAETAKDPAKFIGIHFFSPVERMMLVEIIMGKKTGDAALAMALDFVRAIRKTPIVVNDSRGFYTSRVVGTYIREGHLMLTGGRAGGDDRERRRAWPACRSGRSRSTTRSRSISAWKIVKATEADLGPKAIDPRQKTLLEEHGREAAAGSAARTARASTTIRRRARSGCGRASPSCSRRSSIRDKIDVDVEELKQRLLAIQALETARCFEEGVLTDVREADVGSILGFGFAPFSGGTLSYIDMMGTKKLRRAVPAAGEEIRRALQARKLLLDMAQKGESFYAPLRARAKKAA